MLADRGGAPPSQTRGRHARPVFLYGKLKPFDVLFTASRLWCCGSSKSAFMTFQRVTGPTAFDFGRNRLNVRKNRPMQLLQYGSFVYPLFIFLLVQVCTAKPRGSEKKPAASIRKDLFFTVRRRGRFFASVACCTDRPNKYIQQTQRKQGKPQRRV